MRSTITSVSTPLLRDLDEHEFRGRYSCDRLTASILANRFRYVNAHMAVKLRTNAFSVVIRDMDDFCITIQGPPEQDWAMPAASFNPVHWGPVTDAVGIVLEEVGLDTLRSGDVVVANDSYRTGKHLNDASFIRPLFHDERLVGAVHITAHQFDLGSRVPGGFDLLSQSIWEDGLLLTPMLLYSEGRPVRSTFNLVAANTRFPEVILADLQVINSTLDLGEQLLIESAERYGIDAYLGAIRYSTDVAAEEMSRALTLLPDGIYDGEHIFDGDGRSDSPSYAVKIRIHKHGDRIEFDFSGTSERTGGSLNCSWLDAKTGVSIALMLLFDKHSVPNSGMLRNFDFLLPPGSMVNPFPPTPTMSYYSIVDAVIRATVDALTPALGENSIAFDMKMGGTGHRASGVTPTGEPWVVPTALANPPSFPKGATGDGDADAFGQPPWTNMSVMSYEILELGNPLLVLQVEAAPDSSGPGYNRGGATMISTVQYLHAGAHHHGAERFERGAKGAFGGGDGCPGATMVFDSLPLGTLPTSATPSRRVLPPAEDINAGAGAAFQTVIASGGGWGDPFTREPERVAHDVRDGYVTVKGATRDYGVVVNGDPVGDPENLTVDAAATPLIRSTRRAY